MRRALAAALGVALCVAGCKREEPRAPKPQPARPPDVVLVTIDTLRADHTSVHGYRRPTTPVLEAVAREGALVELAYAPMATTGPSHATMLTSLYPWSHGLRQNGHVLDEKWVSLPERFKAAGYTTGAIVSTYVLKSMFGFAQGFDTFEEGFDAATASLTRERGEEEAREHESREPRDRRADATSEMALKWIAARDRDKPFFLWIHFFDPHDPYWPPAPYNARFQDEADSGRTRAIAAYDAEIAFTDEHLGRVLKALDPSRTLVAITADHGEGLWQHGHKTHGIHLYEEAVHVPLLFRWTGHIPPGTRLPGPTEHTDIAPTLLELAGIPWTGGNKPQGQSLAAGLRGDRRVAGWDERRPVFLQRRSYGGDTTNDGGVPVAGNKFAVRQGPYKYIEAHEEQTRELYDLPADPKEAHNLFKRMQPEGERLSLLIERWRQTHERGSTAREDRSKETDEALRALGYVR